MLTTLLLQGSYKNEKYNTDGTAGIDACGDSTSTLRETLIQAGSMKQESSEGDLEASTYLKRGEVHHLYIIVYH